MVRGARMAEQPEGIGLADALEALRAELAAAQAAGARKASFLIEVDLGEERVSRWRYGSGLLIGNRATRP
jgi:hypothetical protein